MAGAAGPQSLPVRASSLLKVRVVWLMPALLASLLVAIITLAYFGSLVNPAGHLRGLPVELVDEDRGAAVGGQTMNFGRDVVMGLTRTPAVTHRLAIHTTSLAEAHEAMDDAKAYAAIVVPPTFSESVLAPLAHALPAGVPAEANVELLSNQRLGSVGTSLSTAVATPALEKISAAMGAELEKTPEASSVTNPVLRSRLADPFSVAATEYRPLPSHTALGLSAFYLSLLTLMAGFLGATVVNSSLDAAMGFGATEIGVRYRQRVPLPINRWRTLFAKWAVAGIIAPVLTALIVLFAVGILGADAPHVWYLWAFMSVAAIGVATGTLTLFAALGSLGQLVSMIIFVYLGLVSSGGTVPLQAVPGFYRIIGHVEPLRQILGGVRSIIYFGARSSAGLGQSWIVVLSELAFWLVLGTAVTQTYDQRGYYRMQPELLDYVNRSAETYTRRREEAVAGTARVEGQAAEK